MITAEGEGEVVAHRALEGASRHAGTAVLTVGVVGVVVGGLIVPPEGVTHPELRSQASRWKRASQTLPPAVAKIDGHEPRNTGSMRSRLEPHDPAVEKLPPRPQAVLSRESSSGLEDGSRSVWTPGAAVLECRGPVGEQLVNGLAGNDAMNEVLGESRLEHRRVEAIAKVRREHEGHRCEGVASRCRMFTTSTRPTDRTSPR